MSHLPSLFLSCAQCLGMCSSAHSPVNSTHRRHHGGGADWHDLARQISVGLKFMCEKFYCAMDDSLHSNLCITNAHKLILLSEMHQRALKVNMKSELTLLTLPGCIVNDCYFFWIHFISIVHFRHFTNNK